MPWCRAASPSGEPGPGVHPQVHGDRGWFAGRDKLPVLRGTLVHVTVERLPDGRDPCRAMWLWHAGGHAYVAAPGEVPVPLSEQAPPFTARGTSESW